MDKRQARPAKIKGRVAIPSSSNAGVGPSVSRKGDKRKRDQRARVESDEEESGESESEYGDVGEEEMEELDTDEEIAEAQAGRSKKTAKRKRRATSPGTFGAALEQLLGGGADATTSSTKEQPAILSKAPHIRRGAQSSRLNAKAARLALAARRKREDRAHVVDVIGGWGAPGTLPKTEEGEEKSSTNADATEADQLRAWLHEGGAQGYEKRLRKAAQRGVVKLFNAIRAAQNTTTDDLPEEEDKAHASRTTATAGKKAENPLGGKAKAVNELSKNNFFDLLRAGTKSKATVT